jgi:hypothetical protein
MRLGAIIIAVVFMAFVLFFNLPKPSATTTAPTENRQAATSPSSRPSLTTEELDAQLNPEVLAARTVLSWLQDGNVDTMPWRIISVRPANMPSSPNYSRFAWRMKVEHVDTKEVKDVYVDTEKNIVSALKSGQ